MTIPKFVNFAASCFTIYLPILLAQWPIRFAIIVGQTSKISSTSVLVTSFPTSSHDVSIHVLTVVLSQYMSEEKKNILYLMWTPVRHKKDVDAIDLQLPFDADVVTAVCKAMYVCWVCSPNSYSPIRQLENYGVL